MSNEDNVLSFKAKTEAPNTITINFGNSETFTYTLSSGDNATFDNMYPTMATTVNNNFASDLTTTGCNAGEENA